MQPFDLLVLKSRTYKREGLSHTQHSSKATGFQQSSMKPARSASHAICRAQRPFKSKYPSTCSSGNPKLLKRCVFLASPGLSDTGAETPSAMGVGGIGPSRARQESIVQAAVAQNGLAVEYASARWARAVEKLLISDVFFILVCQCVVWT